MPRKSASDKALAARVQELEQALAAETRAREAAEAAFAARSGLLATVSHEVRTPLGAITQGAMHDMIRALSPLVACAFECRYCS